MPTLLINYADLGYFEAQKLNTKTGLGIGGIDRAIPYGRQHLDSEFYARNIQAALIRLDPANAQEYQTRGDAYRKQVLGLDAWVKQQMASVPAHLDQSAPPPDV